ncbi:hypothetical protein TW95_gp1343 [Pandoravirus inopinatum]|uniref:Uncharacterized protein n=1 Tax=Pandoravirus inopinatum TaxID=1605721 RepID=A0A0B5JE77_9VIRU|nr:hypothetical protein TW95_gp1343 [Pandoravirus inopinatum]AJF98077.1 hypothetical protein [Pandoravirus inopinatum]
MQDDDNDNNKSARSLCAAADTLDCAAHDAFGFDQLPSLPLERVFEAYIARGARDAGCYRAARSWIASHWPMVAVAEFDRAARKVHATLAPPSVVIRGLRVQEWQGFDGTIADDRGSVTLVVGAHGPSGKTITAQFIETRMLCEMNRMRGGPRDTPLGDSKIHHFSLGGDGNLEEDVGLAIAFSRRRKFAGAHSDGPRTLLIDGQSIVDYMDHTGARGKLGRIAAVARKSATHMVIVPHVHDNCRSGAISREVDRIVVTAGISASHSAQAALFAPLLGMDVSALDAVLHCMRPFARLVFDRRPESRAGVDAFAPSTTVVSIAGGLSNFFPSALESASS